LPGAGCARGRAIPCGARVVQRRLLNRTGLPSGWRVETNGVAIGRVWRSCRVPNRAAVGERGAAPRSPTVAALNSLHALFRNPKGGRPPVAVPSLVELGR